MAQGFLIVYSVTSPSSFHEVSKFRDRILRVKDADTVPIVIVGNKARVSCCRLLAAALSSGSASPAHASALCDSDPSYCSATSLMTARCPPLRGVILPRALGCRSSSRRPRAALTWRRRVTSWCVFCFWTERPLGQFCFDYAADAVSCRSEKSDEPLPSTPRLLRSLGPK